MNLLVSSSSKKNNNLFKEKLIKEQ